MTYMEYVAKKIQQYPVGMPIYTKKIAEHLSKHFKIRQSQAASATSVAVKRIIESNDNFNLRFYQKGIYYRTVVTPFGERGIDKEKLIADKYILPDKGYETGLTLLHKIGLATQMPREYMIATNKAVDCMRTDEKLGVVIRPPKVKINTDNKSYLQTLDILEILDKSPIDADRPYELIASHIYENNLTYGKLLYFADRYYNKSTVMQLAHTASEGGYIK